MCLRRTSTTNFPYQVRLAHASTCVEQQRKADRSLIGRPEIHNWTGLSILEDREVVPAPRSRTRRPRESRTTAVIGTSATPARNFGTSWARPTHSAGPIQTETMKAVSTQSAAGLRPIFRLKAEATSTAIHCTPWLQPLERRRPFLSICSFHLQVEIEPPRPLLIQRYNPLITCN